MISILNLNLALVLSESEACVLVALWNYSKCTGCAIMATVRNGIISSFSFGNSYSTCVVYLLLLWPTFADTFYRTDRLSPHLLQIREYALFGERVVYPNIDYLTQLNIC